MSAKLRVRRSRKFVTTAVFAAAALVATVAEVSVASAEFRRKAPAVQKTRSVRGVDAGVEALPSVDATAAAAATPTTDATWPDAGSAVAKVPGRGRARAGTLPVHVARPGTAAAPASVKVELLSQGVAKRHGIVGVPLRVRRADGGKGAARVALTVDYASFANAIGGDWSSRLRLVDVASGKVIPTRNDVSSKTLTATVDATPQSSPEASTSMLALSAGAGGGAGDYGATPLSPSAQWQVNNQTGDFAWSYPFRVPPGVNGPTPAVNLNYSSGSVDGRVASTNSQPSWIGEGHSMEWGYVERKYVSCSDDMANGALNTSKTSDLCWRNDNANVVLAGHAGELVKDGASWKLENDDSSKIEKLTNGFNGDNDTEYWKLTTTDGTQYFFGLGKRYATDTIATNAAWTVPVFGNHTGEPCKTATWATSYCTQAWRWNLSYVVDPHGNTMTYFYTPENNNYGRNNNTAISTYQRGGYLARIEYGERKGNEHLTAAPAQVDFTVKERCVTATTATFNCESTAMTSANAVNWPDVPFDQICTDTDNTPGCPTGPSFFTRKRLTQVQTKYLVGTTPTAVDTWAFTHTFPDPGDGTTKALWLSSLQHTGNVGTAIALPSVTFSGVQLQNRVDGLDNAPPLVKWRVSSIMSETGAVVSVNYAPQECSTTNLPASPHTNTMRCFPVFWSPEGALTPEMDYFHKYVVASVVDDDRTGSSADKVAQYTYVDTPAWHYDDNELTEPKYRTWSDYRGYSKVRVTLGNTGEQSVTEYLYFRGMDEDTLPNSGVRDVKITDTENVAVDDHPRLNGMLRETRTLDGSAEVSGAIYDQWISAATAVNGSAKAYLTGLARTRSRVALASGGYRRTESATTYDTYGMASEYDDLGDTAVTTDDLCTRTTYARNTALGILNAVARTETVSKSCAATTSRPADVVSDARTYFDGSTTLGAAPTRGLPTKTEVLDSWTTGPVYKQKNRFVYDIVGRTLESYDALDRKTSFAYTPATTGPVTQMTETNPLLHVNTTTLHPAWGFSTAEVDANGKRTDLSYDALGRLTQAWLPGRAKATFPTSPHMKFTYQIRNNGPAAVTTEELRNDGTYTKSYALYDGLLRPRQAQQPAPGTAGGRVITDTTYDSRGLIADRNGPYYNVSAPTNSLLIVADSEMPAQTRTTYDAVNRPVVESFRVNGVEKWRTTSTYAGDRVHIDPPTGLTPRTSITDARERVVALRQYHGSSPTGTYDETTYEYVPSGRLKSITDAAGNDWSYEYDLRGRLVLSDDPDKGTTTTVYDELDQTVTMTDNRQQTVAFAYDVLGRRTEIRDGSATGPLRASWTYDTVTGAKGKASSSTRWVGTDAYKMEITAYDDAYRPLTSRTVIPAAEGSLAGTYTTNLAYNVDGGVKTIAQPSVTGLPSETLTIGYDNLGLADTLVGYGTYVANTTYSPFGEVLQLSLGSTVGKASWQTYFFEEGTRRLEQALLDREIAPTADADVRYTYDLGGNVKKIKDVATAGTVDTQCFTYDHLRRLTEAWSAHDDCAGLPSLSVMGGVQPYWNSYTYDVTGNRLTDVRHSAAGDTTRTYAYPAPGQPRPHAVGSVTTNGPSGTSTDTYGYDANGNTDARTVGGANDTLTWDVEGRLEKVNGPAGETSFLYDAMGTRLIRRDPSAVTLYLDNTEVRLDRTTNVVRGTRYYTHNGKTIAVRQLTDVETLSTDHHGTANFSVDNATGALTTRRFDPFGLPRDASGTWMGDKSFVGGTGDPSTKLVHLGAREYDPLGGRFISVDPLIEPNDPQQMNGYAYASNNPVSMSDPDGLMVASDGGGGSSKKAGSGGGSTTTTKSTSQTPKAAKGPGQALAHEMLHDTARPLTETEKAQVTVEVARAKEQDAKNRIKESVGALMKIAADELGITAAVNCVTDGESCGEMVMNIVMSFAGGVAGKLLKKYGLPWKWKQGAKLVGRIWNLAGEAIDALRGYFRFKDEVEVATRNADEIMSRADEVVETVADACSFDGATTVLMEGGKRKPISDVDVGDAVLVADPETGRQGVRRVTAAWVHDDTLVDLRLGATTVATTADHRFWNVTDAEWQMAADLDRGDSVLTARGHVLPVTGLVTRSARVGRAYNITVDEVHTYFVGVGGEDVLVHNECPKVPGNPFRGKNAPAQAYKHLEKHHGVDPKVAGNRLHKLKEQGNLGPADDVIIGRTGDVYDGRTGERLGSLTDKGLGTER